MLNGMKIIVIMPAYNAESTLLKTHGEVMAQEIVDSIIIVDDASNDRTVELASLLPDTVVHRHEKNQGYGANQKTCYKMALEAGADIVIMVHPDYQYTPHLIRRWHRSSPMVFTILFWDPGFLEVMRSKGGMPVWKYVANRFLTLAENMLIGAKLSEYHTGYRAFSKTLLKNLPLDQNSDDFVFDNQMLTQILWQGWQIAEITCPTKYFKEASSINFKRSVKYGVGCLATAVKYRLAKMDLIQSELFPTSTQAVADSYSISTFQQ